MRQSTRKLLAATLAVLASLLFFSCGSVQTQKAGRPDTAALEIVGNTKNYPSTVRVSIDGDEFFSAGINDRNDNKHKNQYPISTGSHSVTVTNKGKVIVEKNIYASPGEVKIVELP